MPVTKVRVGFDTEEYGTVEVEGDSLAFAGPNVDAVKDHVRHHAEMLGREAKDDGALDRIKPAAVLQHMVDADQGRMWALDAEEGDDEDTDLYEEEVDEPSEVEEPAPVTENVDQPEYATDPATGLFVRNPDL